MQKIMLVSSNWDKMKTVYVQFGFPSKFYYQGKQISADVAFAMHTAKARFVVNGERMNLSHFGATVGFDLDRNSSIDIPRKSEDEIVQHRRQMSQENLFRAKVENRLRMARGDWYMVMAHPAIIGAVDQCVAYFRSVNQNPPDYDVIACLRHKLNPVLDKYTTWFLSGQSAILVTMFRHKL